jgi:two-component system, NtrC family, sensor kinase
VTDTAAADPQQVIADLQRKLNESFVQQAATADVLKVISRSAFDLQTVTSVILQAAAKLCRASMATLHLRDGDVCHLATQFGMSDAFEKVSRDNPIPVHRPLHSRRQARGGEFAQFADAWNDPEYLYKSTAKLGGYRAILIVPMMRENELIGLFSLGRPDPEPFTADQIELIQTFSDQAVIAIENARLFNETKEALARQTATSEILRVISQSPTDSRPVFDRIIETAMHVLHCEMAVVLLCEGGVFFTAAAATTEGLVADVGHTRVPIDPDANFPSRAIVQMTMVHLPDWSLIELPEHERKVQERWGINSSLYLPLLREGECIGVVALVGKRANSFGPREVAQAESFRDQALIAIENARLFGETQEALEQQKASADVLGAISKSVADTAPVFEAIVDACQRLFGGEEIGIYTIGDGDMVRLAAWRGQRAEEAQRDVTPLAESITGRIIKERRTHHIPDLGAIPNLSATLRDRVERDGASSLLYAPILWENSGLGSILVARWPPRPFSEREQALLLTFANQAAVAIQNARMFEQVQAKTRDLGKALQQQTATAEVLKVISRSAFDLQAVFSTLVTSAVELGGALTGTICVRDGNVFRYRDTVGAEYTSALTRYLREHPAVPGRSTIAGRVLLSGKVERIPDCLADPEFVVPIGSLAPNVRSLLGVPLLRKDGIEGAIILTRAEPGEFTERQIEIVQTFADQAVIAIENVRLFDEVQARTKELAASLDELRTAQDRLVQTEKLASLGQLTVNNFSALSAELVAEMGDVLAKTSLDAATRAELEELAQMLKSNLEKVVQHGKRADSIVKNMLQHSREGSGEHRPVDINTIVDESLNLAFHGARAEKAGFNIALQRDLDPSVGMADLYPQEFTRVLLNIIANGFYAATKRKAEAGEGFEPTLAAVTKNLGDKVEIRIRDNGTGIPNEVKEKIFNPFFTTKPSGEGTGLGLSMSHDIIVKQHGGSIEVDTEPGLFTEFKIVLPRTSQR